MASPESTGGGGTHFETRVVAYYLAATLAEVPARALPGLYATQVSTQRAAFDQPLDDVVIDGISAEGRSTKLSLQIKSTLTFTENDAEWVDVLAQAWSTFTATTFDSQYDRLGVAISSYSARADKHYQAALNWAAQSPSGEYFIQRIEKEDFSHKDQRTFVSTTRKILESYAGQPIDDTSLWRFLSSFRILHFDFESHESSRDTQHVLDRIRHVLARNEQNRAADAWAHLIAVAGELTPAGGGVSRASLTAELRQRGLPIGSSTTFWTDIQKINHESRQALSSIKADIHGLRLNRVQFSDELYDALSSARFVQIDGEPGSGKSALLRQLAEECAQLGPAFVLKDNRIQPRGWASHAGHHGISSDLVSLLSEFAAVSEAILFIDGIDKIDDPASQLTVNDLIRAIASEPTLATWRVLVTVREQNLDHIETWLDPDAIAKLQIRTVTLPSLSSTELDTITTVFPRLGPLLRGSNNTDVVLHRPFFIEAILSLAGQEGTTALPATEVELLRLWWGLGGADNPQFTPAQHRRNVLLQLAERLTNAPNQAVAIRDLAPEPLEDLKSAGVIRDKELGHNVIFSHDIYEEWVLCEWLIASQSDIISLLKKYREPQILVRPVQLLGLYQLETRSTDAEWKHLYEGMSDSSLRPIWQRVVLTSCLQSTRTTQILGKLASYLHQGDDSGIRKLLNALQTLEVLPNATLLKETAVPHLRPDERVTLSQAAPWPKVGPWVRFLDWYLPHVGTPSPSLIPDLLPVFTIWQSSCAGKQIRHCKRIGELAHAWLSEFEAALHPINFHDLRAPFDLYFDSDTERNLEDAIRRLLLLSTADVPELVTAYLAEQAKDRQGHQHRDKILANSPTVARSLPRQLVNFILDTFLSSPKDDDWQQHSSLRREERGINGHDSFYPASPLQLPFLLLLREHEEEGLRLVRAICNHSIDIWQWLCQHPSYYNDTPATPLPVEIEFSWGKQIFWGDSHVYLWFRGSRGNHASQCALMALELWAFERIEAGEDFSEILQKVLKDNRAAAVLGIAVSLCLAYIDQSIEHALPLVTCAYIWMWEPARAASDSRGQQANEIADWRRYGHLLHAVRELNHKPHRKLSISHLVPYFVFTHDVLLKDRYTSGIRSFTEKLPFEYKEEQSDEDWKAALTKRMSWYVEQADPQFWHSEPTEDGKHIQLWNDPPSANSEERLKIRKEYEQLNRYLRIALWAQKCIDNEKLDESISIAEALSEAQGFDREDLFDHTEENLNWSERQGAVAGAAYVFAKHAPSDLWNDATAAWTIQVLQRSATMHGSTELTARSSILPMHPLLFATYGFTALLVRGYEARQCQTVLLTLALHPLESVSEAVAISAKQYATSAQTFYAVLFTLLLHQCIIERSVIPSDYSVVQDKPEIVRSAALVESALNSLEDNEIPELPSIPLPWLKQTTLDSHGKTEVEFERNPTCFQWHIAQKTILRFDINTLLAIPTWRSQFLTLVEQLLAMTIQEIIPPFAKSRRDNRGNIPYHWVFAFFHWLGKTATYFSFADTEKVILPPIFAMENEASLLAMRNFIPSYMVHAVLPPASMTEDAFRILGTIAEWVIENPAGRVGHGRHVSRDFSSCLFTLLFCFSGDFQPLVCGVEPGWSPLERFKPMIERVVTKFGTNTHLYIGLLRFLQRGGLDFIPEPGLTWLYGIVSITKQDQEFWSKNGEETVELLKLILEKKPDLSSEHRKSISIITDVLVDNGVRGAGFLQQDQLRE